MAMFPKDRGEDLAEVPGSPAVVGERIPLVRPYFSDVDESAREYRRILESGMLTNFGERTRRLEALIARRLQVAHAVAVANATTGLGLLIEALELKDDAEIVMPSFTFAATFMAVARTRERFVPVFADVDPQTFVLDPASVQACITPRTAAIVGVHVFGVRCEHNPLAEIADRHGLRLIYDAAHALGSLDQDRPVGGQGDAQVFSLSATKLLPCGEGGIVATNDHGIYRGLLDRRNYGFSSDRGRDCFNLGWNGKLQEASAALGVQELATLAERVARRNRIASRYRAGLEEVAGISFQQVPADAVSSYKDFAILIDSSLAGITRADLQRALSQAGIDSEPYFSPAVHQLTVVARRFPGSVRVPLPQTERLARTALSLPMHEHLSDAHVDTVIAAIQRACR